MYARFVSTNVRASAVDVYLANNLPMQGHSYSLYFHFVCALALYFYALPMQELQSSLHSFVYAVARSKKKKNSSLVHAFVYAGHAAKFNSL